MRGTDEDRYIGARIRRVRQYRSMTLDELSEACYRILEIRGISKDSNEHKGFLTISLSEMERGRTRIPPQRLEVIAAALEIEPTKLLPADWMKTDDNLSVEAAVVVERLRRLPEKKQKDIAKRLHDLLDAYS